MKTLQLVFLVMFGIFNAQILEKYPDNQENYYGGPTRFYKDFHQIIIDHHLKPCTNKNEFYNMAVVVYPDKTIKFVHPQDTLAVKENQCTVDLSKRVLAYMDRWKPAVVDGKDVTAMAILTIFPDDLFDKYQEGYTPDKFFKEPDYQGGIKVFREEVIKNANLNGFKFAGAVHMLLTFVIERDGSMSNLKVQQSSGLKQFDEVMLSNLKSVKNRWIPGSFHGIPLRSRFRLPINIAAQ